MKMTSHITAITLGLTMTLSITSPASAADWKPTSSPLMTRWAKDVTPETAWPEYPRPQLTRGDWQNLNGLWDIALRENAIAESPKFDKKILVPFPIEAPLSGLAERANHALYRREFTVPPEWNDKRVLLHFDAVDWQTSVTVNGKLLKTLDGDEIHQGGYDRFSYDITDALKDGSNELQVSVFDPTEKGDQPRGKQVTKSHGIWYTPTTGIWQTVWLEPVSKKGSIRSLKFTPDAAAGTVTVGAETLGAPEGSSIKLIIKTDVPKPEILSVTPGKESTLRLQNVHLWSPNDPYLYEVEARLKVDGEFVDVVKTYFGLRDIETKMDGKFRRIYLNGKEIFQIGPLDQGFWPDGVYTPPTVEAMNWDIDYTRELGFNMIRKHIKVEPDLWYYHCDKTGMLVWQDAVNGVMKTEESHKQFEQDLHRMIENHFNSPAIVLWTIFNEGWGQYDTERLTEVVRKQDPTRLITNPSGWVDKGVGDTQDMHKYPGPGAPDPDPKRASVLGEFGGLGLFIDGHSWGGKLWGYQGMDTKEQLFDRFSGMMKGLKYLRSARGLNAAVYTQTTDVEIEANGLVTYDREVKKMDSAAVRAINQSIIDMADQRVIAETSLDEPAPQWQYTMEKPSDDWMSAEFDAKDWKTSAAGFGKPTKRIFGKMGTLWTSDDIWLRRNVDLTATVKPQNVQMMVVHAEDAEIYINGVKAAELKGLVTGYTPVNLSAEATAALKPGDKNIIAVHCHSNTEGNTKKDIGQFIDVGLIEVGASE